MMTDTQRIAAAAYAAGYANALAGAYAADARYADAAWAAYVAARDANTEQEQV